jgi:hypothetical protein
MSRSEIMKFVVALTPADGAAELRRRNNECQQRRRAEFVAKGLTVLGTKRKRSPNGMRKVYR